MLKYISVLILDDDKVVRVSFEQQFMHYSDVVFKTYLAKNLQEAKEIIANNKIDFAVVDLYLPDGTGEDFLDFAPQIKSIILSSNEDSKRREALFYKGILDYFSKDNPLNYIFGEIVKNIIKYENNKGLTIAIANESAIVRKFIKTIFENKNYTVLEAKDGLEVLALVQNFDISLLMIDIEMPKIDGIKILYEIRAKKELQELPVFILSNITDTNKIASILKNGADEFIHKNFSVEHLLIKAENAIASYVVHQELIHLKQSLQRMVDDKTHQLKELNESLEKQVRYRTIELQSAKEIIDKYVIISNTDKNGKITEVSEAFAKASGYDKDELIGKSHAIVKNPDETDDRYKEIWDTIQSGNTWEGEFKNLSKDGSNYYIKTHIVPKKDIIGNITGYMSVSNDITDKYTIAEQKVQLISQSRLASIGEMMSLITHQWKQPLAVLATSIANMQFKNEMDSYDFNNFNNDLGNLLPHIEYMNETITVFTSFFRPNKHIQTITTNEIVEYIQKLAQVSIQKYGIAFDIINENNIPFKSIKNELVQVLINLISNAKDVLIEKKTKDSKLTLTITKEENVIVFSVKDNGGGIKEEILKTLFTPYITSKGENGTGLGLYMAKKIITSLGGTIEAKNIDGGAEFRVVVGIEEE